jgi:hypothetical protein
MTSRRWLVRPYLHQEPSENKTGRSSGGLRIEMNENLFEAVLMIALVVITMLFLNFAS